MACNMKILGRKIEYHGLQQEDLREDRRWSAQLYLVFSSTIY